MNGKVCDRCGKTIWTHLIDQDRDPLRIPPRIGEIRMDSMICHDGNPTDTFTPDEIRELYEDLGIVERSASIQEGLFE